MIKTHVKSIIGHHRSSAICKPEALRTSRMARARESDNTKCRQDVGEAEPSRTAGEKGRRRGRCGEQPGSSPETGAGRPSYQHFPLVLPRRREHTCPHVNLHTDIRTASLARVERRREPTCAWPGEWKSRVVRPRGGMLPDHDEEWNPYPRFAGLSSEYVMLK